MEKAQHGDSGVLTIGLERPYRVPLRAILLAMIGDDHADAVTPARERPGKQRLLDRLAADEVLPVVGREHRQIVESNEADLHRAVASFASARASPVPAFAIAVATGRRPPSRCSLARHPAAATAAPGALRGTPDA